jgi:drug/metabolite transporter (DMT)-like permease
MPHASAVMPPLASSWRARVILALAAVYLIWGSTYYAMRLALESLPPLLMAGIRFLVAGAGLYLVLRMRGVRAPSRAEWKTAALLGLFLLIGGNGLVAYSQQWVSSSLAAIVVATMPLWAALFARFAGQKPTASERAGLWIGFAGVLVLNAGGELGELAPGALVLLLAPLSWAWGSMQTKTKKLAIAPGGMGLAAMMTTAGAALLILGAARGERIVETPTVEATAALVYLIVFGSLVGLTAYTYLLDNVRPALATSYAYVNPVVAVAIGVGLGGEQLGTWTLVALGVILAGVALVTSGPFLERRLGRERAPAPSSRSHGAG